MRPDAPGVAQLLSDVAREADVRDAVVVQMAELPGAGEEAVLVPTADPRGRPGPAERFGGQALREVGDITRTPPRHSEWRRSRLEGRR